MIPILTFIAGLCLGILVAGMARAAGRVPPTPDLAMPIDPEYEWRDADR